MCEWFRIFRAYGHCGHRWLQYAEGRKCPNSKTCLAHTDEFMSYSACDEFLSYALCARPSCKALYPHEYRSAARRGIAVETVNTHWEYYDVDPKWNFQTHP
ncbi:hypothetical protein ABKN59_002678 [Abortiporus biennis]